MIKLAGMLLHSDNKFYRLKDCMVYKRCRYPYEDLIVKKRDNERAISEIEEPERLKELSVVLLKISVFLGVSLPSNELLLEMLTSLFQDSLINFGYENLSLKELLFAFELNKQNVLKDEQGDLIKEVEDPFKSLNIGYTSKVLKNYMIARNLLDAKAKNVIYGGF